MSRTLIIVILSAIIVSYKKISTSAKNLAAVDEDLDKLKIIEMFKNDLSDSKDTQIKPGHLY